MAYALVGVLGNNTSTAANTINTPPYGQTPTLGNLLILWINGNSASTLPAAISGWTVATDGTHPAQRGATNCSSSILWRIATGGDAAPSVAAASGTAWHTRLGEFSGGPSVTPVDSTGSNAGTTSTLVATGTLADTAGGELVIAGAAFQFAVGATSAPTTLTFNNGATAAGLDNGSTSTTGHWAHEWGITTGNGGADTATLSWTGTATHAAAVVASFKLGGLSYSVSLSEASVATESLAVKESYGRPIANASTTTEGLLVGRGFPRPTAEASVSTESLARKASLVRAPGESSATGESWAVVASLPRPIGNASATVETLVVDPGRSRSISDASAAVDHVTTAPTLSLTRVAAVSGLFPSPGLYPQGTVYPGYQGDGSLSADVAAFATANPRPVANASASIDAWALLFAASRSTAEASVSGDVATGVRRLLRPTANASVSADALAIGSRLAAIAADLARTTDSLTIAISTGSVRGTLETSTFADSPKVTIALSESTTDLAASMDTTTRLVPFARSMTDGSATVEALVYTLQVMRSATDTSATANATTAISTYFASVVSLAATVDAIVVALSNPRNVTDVSATGGEVATGFGVYSVSATDEADTVDVLVTIAYTTHRGDIVITHQVVGALSSASWSAINNEPVVVSVGQ